MTRDQKKATAELVFWSAVFAATCVVLNRSVSDLLDGSLTAGKLIAVAFYTVASILMVGRAGDAWRRV